ncbi:MAG: GTP-binding protein [Promethearchaeota archaeon]|nr:MAG: GTP-binding protein [Candidatus Lokiarchaeota archaeon]
MTTDSDIIKGLIFSQFDEKFGPKAIVSLPEELLETVRNQVSLKSIMIMSGADERNKGIGVLPFPDLGLKGLVRTFFIKDDTVRGGIIDSSLTLLFNEIHDAIIYKYMNNFEEVIIEITDKIEELLESDKVIDKKFLLEIISSGLNTIMEMLNDFKQEEERKYDIEPFPKTKEEKEGRLYKFKILVVGDPGVGKTSIVLRYTNKAFRRTYIPTLGVNITEKTVKNKNQTVRFVIWDVAGQSKYALMRKHYYEGANGILLIFDLTRVDSFKNLVDWYKDVKKYIEADVLHGFILANKNDLEEDRKINQSDINQMEEKIGLKIFETSALTGENVDKTFVDLTKLLVKNQ